jgi:hypothetical protein
MGSCNHQEIYHANSNFVLNSHILLDAGRSYRSQYQGNDLVYVEVAAPR